MAAPSPAGWLRADRVAPFPASRLAAGMVFVLLYLPFVYTYAILYTDVDNADLPSFYAAAHAAFVLHRSPYAPAALRRRMGGMVWPFLHPPTGLLAFFPMSLFTYPQVKLAMLWINHAAALVLLLELLRHPGLRGPPCAMQTVLFVAYLLTFTPLVVTLNHGQTNIVVALILMLFWRLAAQGHDGAAAALLSVAILLKTPVALVLLVPLLLDRRALVVRTLALSAAFVVVSFLLLPGLWADWIRDVMPTLGYGRTPVGLFGPDAEWNQGFNGVFSRLTGASTTGRVATYAASVLSLVVSVLAVRGTRARPEGRDPFRLGMTIVLPLVYLVDPLSWEHHLVCLLPTAVLQLSQACFHDFPAEPRLRALVIPGAILLALPFGLGYKFFGALALWVAAIVSARSEGVQTS